MQEILCSSLNCSYNIIFLELDSERQNTVKKKSCFSKASKEHSIGPLDDCKSMRHKERTVHTTVLGPQGSMVRVQLRFPLEYLNSHNGKLAPACFFQKNQKLLSEKWMFHQYYSSKVYRNKPKQKCKLHCYCCHKKYEAQTGLHCFN